MAADRVGRTGARFPSAGALHRWSDERRDAAARGDDAGAGASRTAPAGGPPFELALRGYDRGQVDAFVARVRAVVRGVRDELADSEQRRRALEEHAAVLEAELRELHRSRGGAADRGDDVGRHAERYLKLARREAAAIRAEAVAEARSIVERARRTAGGAAPPRPGARRAVDARAGDDALVPHHAG